MQNYINQLIEDLHEIADQVNLWGNTEEEEPINDEETFLKHIADVERYVSGDDVLISDIAGIAQEELPPPERLNEKQQSQIAVELEYLLQHFHFALDFPDNYPKHLRYGFIKKLWTEKHPAMQFGTSHIGFCSYEKENCPFPGYCNSCDEFETDDEDLGLNKLKDRNTGELPF